MARIDVDGEGDARVEGAVFEAVRVRGGRLPWLPAAAGLAVAALVLIGVAGGRNPVPAASPARQAAAVAATPLGRSMPPPAATRQPRPTSGGPIGPASRPDDLVVLDLRPAGSHLFVHGDVFSVAVSSVSVALLDSEGKVAARERVPMPGGSRSFWTTPNPRFDVHFAVPDEMMGDGLSIEVAAFDTDGGRIATFREPVISPLGPF